MKCGKSLFLSPPIFCTLISFFLQTSASTDTISATQFINGSQTLVSNGQNFVLGFFARDAYNQYLGIWYKNIPQTVVWVANRENPVVNSTGLLTFASDGNLIIQNQAGHILWSSNTAQVIANPIARLLDSGNFVLINDSVNNSEEYLWQSFDYPSDTLLPGQKHGWNLKTGLNRKLTSWKGPDDPSPGEYTFTVELYGFPQVFIRKGSTILYRTGPWTGKLFNAGGNMIPNTVFDPIFVYTKNEVYYTFEGTSNNTSRYVLYSSGLVQHTIWTNSSWSPVFTPREDRCDDYNQCGVYGSCEMIPFTNCECLSGFEPRFPQDWNKFVWSGGCVRKDLNICGNGEGFTKFSGLKLPEALENKLDVTNLSIKDCEAKCLSDCSCMAYAQLDLTGIGTSCVTWYEGLNDIRVATANGHDLYVRVAASSLALNSTNQTITVTVSVALAMLLLVALISSFVLRKGKKAKAHLAKYGFIITDARNRNQENGIEMPLFDFAVIEVSTNNFSTSNKIGEGGFGPVYKGELLSGQEVAVKRLSQNSGQGLEEFKNEVLLISNLQHRNLVNLLGCCIQGEERLLIYEYMSNKSLDNFIFDDTRRSLLKWNQRLEIIIGIARGLLYLHRDSRLRIIHRDLKISNILLDSEMNPKISDFGMARIFGEDQTKTRTRRVVGTYGYMSPEYAIDGYFSIKSDVFSFGVVVLEIISGKRNRGFFHPDHQLNLLGHAWQLWNEEKALELMDTDLENEFSDLEAMRCINVGLLCVQQRPEDRPTMSSVLLMLDNGTDLITKPGKPGFYSDRTIYERYSPVTENMACCSNEVTISLLYGR